MASGKMSPRQKMINMMYLVLLALLALNVSAEILDAFENIRQKLATSAGEAQATSVDFVSNMKATIKEEIENENKRTNAGLLDTLDQVSGQTSQMIAIIDGHIATLRDSLGKVDPETGEMEGKGETEKNMQYWMGQGKAQEANDGRGSGEAYQLREQYEAYIDYLAAIYNSQVKDPSQRLNAEEYKPQDPESDGGARKSWERYTFDAPLIANLATLEAIKLDIYGVEKQLLDLLNTRLGVATFKVDSVVAINAPVSTIVPAGLQFQTRLFVAMSSSQITPQFSSSSGSIEREGTGALLTIPASGGVIPDGKNEGKQSYSASIQVPKATGGFQTLTVSEEFTVRKPEIVITSAAVQNLYRNCGNDINIDVPALGDLYSPRISATSAEVFPNKESKKRFLIVPTARATVVSVASVTNGQTVKIGDVKYKVIEPPKPDLLMIVNGKEYNGSALVPKASRIGVVLKPDEDFKAALPNDARYGISSIDVLAQLSLGPPTKVNSVRGSNDATRPIEVSLGTQVRQSARPGTKIYVRVDDIFRINFQNKRVNDPRFSEADRTLSLVVR